MKRHIALLLGCLLLTGCASGYELATGELATEIGDPAISPEKTDGPPLLRMELVTDTTASVIPLDRSTFCWDGLCVDFISPAEMYDQGLVQAVFYPDMLAKDPRLLLPEDAELLSVHCWSGEDLPQEVRFTDDGVIPLSDIAVGCAYDVQVRYPEGSCCYVFATQYAVQDHGSDSSDKDSDGATTPSYTPPSASSPSKPPLLTILTEDAGSFNLSSGNYNWTVYRGEEASDTIACGASPMQAAKGGSAKKIPASDGVTLQLSDGAEVSAVKCWLTDSEYIVLKPDPSGFVTLSGKGSVYSVDVEFPQGRAEYVFVTEPAEEPAEAYSYTDDGLFIPQKVHYYRTDDFNADNALRVVTSLDDDFPQYGDDFFRDNALITFSVTEGSGSIRHEIRGIGEDNVIHLTRYVPEVGTCDMAQYTIVIEVPKALAGGSFTVKYNDIFR